MAKRVGVEDIQRINELYYKYKTYAEVARQTGFAPSTVKKYVDPNWRPLNENEVVKFTKDDLPDFTTDIFRGVKNFGDLCVLSEEERKEIEELWKELSI